MSSADIEAAKEPGGVKYSSPQMVARGWFFNDHTREVSLGCSDGHHHSWSGDVTTTQQMGTMYRTKADALRVMRFRLTERFAEQLAKVDRAIEGSP